MSKLIETPYGRKTPELLCAAMDALERERAREAEQKAKAPSRWKCRQCGSRNVEVSYPAWFREGTDYSIELIEPDNEADPLWFYCEDCEANDASAVEV